MSSPLLKSSSEKKIASVDVKDIETAGLSEKVIRDLDNPKSRVAQNVNKAVFEAWGIHLAAKDGKLFMGNTKSQGR